MCGNITECTTLSDTCVVKNKSSTCYCGSKLAPACSAKTATQCSSGVCKCGDVS